MFIFHLCLFLCLELLPQGFTALAWLSFTTSSDKFPFKLCQFRSPQYCLCVYGIYCNTLSTFLTTSFMKYRLTLVVTRAILMFSTTFHTLELITEICSFLLHIVYPTIFNNILCFKNMSFLLGIVLLDC